MILRSQAIPLESNQFFSTVSLTDLTQKVIIQLYS